jgi:HK97 family phage major capsid protein
MGASSGSVNFAEVTSLPTTSIPGEGSELAESDPVFTQRTLTLHTYRAGTILSLEQLEDSIESPQHIMNPLFQSIADKISYDFVNGSGSGAPLGLKNMTGVYMRLHLGVNGSALTGYEELGALWEKARNLNHRVSHFVMSPRTYKEYKQLEDANEAPKQNPWGEIPMVESVHVLNTETEGTSTNCTRVYAGDYQRNVVLAWRYGGPDSIKFLVDRNTLGEFAKIRIYAYCRVGILHPRGTAPFGFAKAIIPPSGAIT